MEEQRIKEFKKVTCPRQHKVLNSLGIYDSYKWIRKNKWLQNIIYCSQGPDNYLYFTSSNPQFKYLEKVKYTGIFENAEQAARLSCDTEESKCDILNMEFPLEDSLIPQLIELIVKELTPVEYKPIDAENNASDDLANINKK